MFTWNAHDRVKNPQTGLDEVRQTNNYVMLCNGPEHLQVQHGKIYTNGSTVIAPDEAPAWFWESFEKLAPATRKAVGLALPKDRIQSASQLPADFLRQLAELPPEVLAQITGQAPTIASKAPKTSDEYEDEDDTEEAPESLVEALKPIRPSFWTCTNCGIDVEIKKKGVHMARLKRLGRCS